MREQVENSSGCHGFASSMVMHDVTRGAATRLSTSTFDIRGSLVKAFVRCLASVTRVAHGHAKLFILILFLPVSSFPGDCLSSLCALSLSLSLLPQLLSTFCFSNCVPLQPRPTKISSRNTHPTRLSRRASCFPS